MNGSRESQVYGFYRFSMFLSIVETNRIKMLKNYKISLVLLFFVIALLALGELASGTSLYFVALMSATMLCIGITYNLLGGVGTISGIAFTGFALCTFVISQFAKVLFFEAAETNLEAPTLTIKVYFVFYFCTMVGVFVYGRLRVKLPKPLEPATTAQAALLYVVSVSVGLISTISFEVTEFGGHASGEAAETHSLSLAFSGLLLFAIVLATQAKIRESNGQRSFGAKVFLPWVSMVFFGFVSTSRGGILLPSIVYVLTCYVSGYRFRTKHYIAGVLGIVVAATIISPFEIYARGATAGMTFQEKVSSTFALLAAVPDWIVVKESSEGGSQTGSREEYYNKSGTFILSRLSAIRADSNMINACSTGYHYGFTALRLDVLHNIPRILYKNKPAIDSAAFTGRVTGINSDEVENGEFMITAVSDSYGAFGWWGVVIVPLVVFPATFIIYESVFDISRPWGIVAMGAFCFPFSEVNMGGLINLAIRTPISLVFLSYVVGVIIRMIPVKGAHEFDAGRAMAE